MSKGESLVIPSFRPFENLKQKPDKVQKYESLYVFPKETKDDGGVIISRLISNELEEHKTIDRETILERFQKNGILVSKCQEKKEVDFLLPEPADIVQEQEEEKEKEEEDDSSPMKGRKLDTAHIQLDKTGFRQESQMDDEDLEKEIPMPKEPKYVEENVQVDERTVFVLCSSKDTEKAPGKEPSESIPKERMSEFFALERIPHWRQKLCNSFDEAPFIIDNITWNTVDHFLIAAQYRKHSIQDVLMQYDRALIIHSTKKHGKLKLEVDEDYKEREAQEMFHALYAKFTQHPELARILEATKDARLYYRINKQKKVEAVELMWLRQVLKAYVRQTLKPLNEAPLATKLRKKVTKEAIEYDLSKVDIGQYAAQLPVFTPEVVKASAYYMNNRTEFIQQINELFKTYTVGSEDNNSEKFDLLSHQKVVRDYLDAVTPYRGLLVYHNLGTGKSCTSIAVTEGMKSKKKVIIMVPAALKKNYEYELQKCGDLIYRNNQYWEFVSIDGKPDTVPVLAKALGMSTKEVSENGGAWMVNRKKPANFKTLNPDQQLSVRKQIIHMISQKYTFIHYNANNLSTKIGELKKISANPFDHTTIVVDEAHNFISNIVGNIKAKNKTSVYVKLYDMLMDAVDLKIVMLSGTPIINYPQEIGVLFNILRGYIYTWTFKIKVNTSEKITTDYIRNIFDKHNCVVYDFIEYSRNTLVITRNPYGFVNVNEKEQRMTTHSVKLKSQLKNATKRQTGGYGLYGVKLDEKGNISNEEFKNQVTQLLGKYDLVVEGAAKLVKEKSLPDDEKTFQSTFLRESTNFADKNDTSPDIQHVQTLRRRILGLTSYFRSPNEKLLPEFVLNAENNTIHEVRVPMSDYQFAEYAKVRKVELEKEKKSKKMRGMGKKLENGELFQMSSTYRVFSRTLCNFAFPSPPGRPYPQMKNDQEEDETDVDGLEDITKEGKISGEYEKLIENAMEYLKENRSKLLSMTSLTQNSPKMLEILKRLKNKDFKGLHLLYSNFVTMEGIGVFQEILNANGYQEFKVKKNGNSWVLDYEPDGRQCYALYTGNEDPDVREIVRNVFNGDWENVPETISIELRKVSNSNLYGEIIQLFMITAAGAEGINLKNTRFVHIMEPYWHIVRLEQVIGRACRIKSHIALPEELRTVQVFLYMSVMSETQKKDEKFKEIQVNDLSKLKENTPVTTDEYLYEISQMKQKINNQFLRIIKETAMDCHLYVQKHKKHEPLVCYGRGFAPDRTFVSYPSQKMDLQEDESTDQPQKSVKMNIVMPSEAPKKIIVEKPRTTKKVDKDNI